MSEYERFIKIHIGTPHEYVIKDIINNETYGMFKGDDKAVIQLLKTINELNEENDELKQENHDIKHTLEELYYTYIYEPSENYDEEALGQITNLLFKDEMKD